MIDVASKTESRLGQGREAKAYLLVLWALKAATRWASKGVRCVATRCVFGCGCDDHDSRGEMEGDDRRLLDK